MIDFNILMAVLSVIILFLFSIRKFSKNINQISGKKFKDYIRNITKTPLRGTLVGAGVTSVVQSSSATTIILVSLVHSGVISFRNSLGVIFGANIGTTITSQLIALKLTAIAPFFIVLGFFIDLLGGKKYRLFGKPIFYFGLIFFSLSLIASYIEPISSSEEVITFLSASSNLYIALLMGIGFTILVQSSSVTSGLAVVLVSAGLLDFSQAIGIIFGANIGTTSTALFSSIGLNEDAKKTAIAHFLFNVGGVILFLPFLSYFSSFVIGLGGSAAQQVANAHIIFNVVATIIFLIFIGPFERVVNKIYHRFGKDHLF